jgi:hypothetical protein
MKKIVRTTMVVLLFLSALTSRAQTNVGIRAGINLSTYHYKFGSTLSSYSSSNQTLITIGFPVEIRLKNCFALQIELNFIQKGFKGHLDIISIEEQFNSDNTLIVNWLELPILAKVNLRAKKGICGGFFLGPSIGYGLGGYNKNSFILTQNGVSSTNVIDRELDFTKHSHSRFDIALNIGGEISNGGLFLDVRYQLGLMNMNNPINGNLTGIFDFKATTRGLALTFGYRVLMASKPKKFTN